MLRACRTCSSAPARLPEASISRRRLSKTASRRRRWPSCSRVMPFRVMLAMPSALGLNAAWARPGSPARRRWPRTAWSSSATGRQRAEFPRRVGPWSLLTVLPSEGQPPPGARCCDRPCMHWKAACCPSLPTMERMTANRSIRCAMPGSSSQIWMPGTRVLIGLNSPRISAGASGLRSTMSWWGGPPDRKTMMTDLCELLIPAWASARRICGSDSPPRAKPPICRKLRRDRRSQNW